MAALYYMLIQSCSSALINDNKKQPLVEADQSVVS